MAVPATMVEPPASIMALRPILSPMMKEVREPKAHPICHRQRMKGAEEKRSTYIIDGHNGPLQFGIWAVEIAPKLIFCANDPTHNTLIIAK